MVSVSEILLLGGHKFSDNDYQNAEVRFKRCCLVLLGKEFWYKQGEERLNCA